MAGMPMPGGWTMTMTWMRMPGQTWPGAALSFLAMWIGMMVAMMLPSLIPMMCRYRHAVGRIDRARLGLLMALVGAGYFFVWTAIGAAAYPIGAALTAIEMQQPAISRAVPIAVCATVLIAGRCSSRRGKRITWPAAVRRRSAAAGCRRRPGRRGGTASASASIAAAVAPA